MLASLTKNWWTYLLRGLIGIIFGVLLFVFPKPALMVLVYFFGAFAVTEGILVTAAGVNLSGYNVKDWWVVLLQGIAGIIIGIVTFFTPNITWTVLLAFIAAWAIVTGILEIVAGIRMRKVIKDEWELILGGILSIVLGVLLVVFPDAGSVGLVWALGVFAIVNGIRNIVFAFRLKEVHQHLETAGV